jgi:hypothetical protein
VVRPILQKRKQQDRAGQHMLLAINQRRENNMATTSQGVRDLYTAKMAKGRGRGKPKPRPRPSR